MTDVNDVESIFNDLLDKAPSAAAMTEANDRTIPGGTYRFDIVKKEMESAGEKSPWPGRPMVRVTADAMLKGEDGEYKRRGRITFDLSPFEVRIQKTGRLDNQSRLWSNLVAAVGKGATNRDALEYLGQFPLTATVSRTFKTLDGTWSTPKTEEDANRLIQEGAEPRNFVQTIRAFNG